MGSEAEGYREEKRNPRAGCPGEVGRGPHCCKTQLGTVCGKGNWALAGTWSNRLFELLMSIGHRRLLGGAFPGTRAGKLLGIQRPAGRALRLLRACSENVF